MVRSVLIFIGLVCGLEVVPQDSERGLRFVLTQNAVPLELDEPIVLADGTPLTITRFRFYVSHVCSFSQGRIAFIDSSCHLVDASDPKSLFVRTDHTGSAPVDSIAFLLGIDSLTNVSGAFGGDLDPTKGMYWTWNSGYINWKLEGTCVSCSAVKKEFQFHLGGYMPPYASAQEVGFGVKGEDVITIGVDVSEFLSNAKLGERCTVMSPGNDAVEMARLAASVFSIPQRDED